MDLGLVSLGQWSIVPADSVPGSAFYPLEEERGNCWSGGNVHKEPFQMGFQCRRLVLSYTFHYPLILCLVGPVFVGSLNEAHLSFGWTL